MDESAGGRSSSLFMPASRARSGEDVKGHPLLAFRDETLRLQVEHRAIPAAPGHELVVGAELDHAAVLEHADSIREADGGEAVRDENGRALPRGGEDAAEDLGLAAHIELRGRLIEQ